MGALQDDFMITVRKFEPGSDIRGRETRAIVEVEFKGLAPQTKAELSAAMLALNEAGRLGRRRVTNVEGWYRLVRCVRRHASKRIPREL